MTSPKRRGEIHLGDLALALGSLHWETDEGARAIADCLGFGFHAAPKPRQSTEIYDRQRYRERAPQAQQQPKKPLVIVPPAPELPPVLPENELVSRLESLTEPAPPAPADEDWLDEPDALYAEEVETQVARQSLFSERTNRHILTAVLATLRSGMEIDIRRLIETVCRREVVPRLPRRPDSTLELGCQLLLDYSATMVPFWEDLDTLEERISFASPLPAQLHVAGEGRTGAWHRVTNGSRIRISPPSPSLRLTTLDGRQWDLRTDGLPDRATGAASEGGPAPMSLAYVQADREQAFAIAGWLREKGITVEPVEESARTAGEGAPTGEQRVLRLWTRAAQGFWADRPAEQSEAMTGGLLLRTEDADLPSVGTGPGRVLNWQDWSRLDESPEAGRLLENLQRWRDGGEIEPEVESGAEDQGTPAKAYSEEVAALLAEIDDPALASCAAAPGTTSGLARARTTATLATRTSATAPLAFVWCVRPPLLSADPP